MNKNLEIINNKCDYIYIYIIILNNEKTYCKCGNDQWKQNLYYFKQEK